MDYIVSLDKFEGPLDLLLHLIKQSNIDIMDINLEDITKQYLDYINKIEEMNLDVASEYLVMAAELIELKSRTLLPKPEVDPDEYEEDPRQELIKKLIAYQAYKEVTPELQELEANRSMYFSKEPSLNITGVDLNPELSSSVDMDALTMAFSNFLKKKELEKPLNTRITNKEYSVHERSREIKHILTTRGKVKFEELFEEYNRNYIVVTFLSILIMAKNGELVIEQEDNFEELYISKRK
ncbi:MAG: segregation/condensation protein A [Bacilli bacterium]|nr:segregation/condensation protein A [Bacilli bacterium]